MTPYCVPDCGCDTDPVDDTDPLDPAVVEGPPTVGCALGARDAEHRIGEWRTLLRSPTRATRSGGKVHAALHPSAGVITELARLCEAEMSCCPFLEFTIAITAGSIELTVGGPPDVEPLIDALFDMPGRPEV